MYGWIWRHLPGNAWLKALISIVLTLGFSVFTVTSLLLLVFGPRIGKAVAAWFGLSDVFTVVWNVASWPHWTDWPISG